MSTMKDKGFIDVLCNKSTIAHFTAEKVGAVPVPLPPVDEQHAIATLLDRETAKIDALIAEQQRLIELLQEKRQAVISHAVTKGLNPDAPMKNSGVEWLGEVPEHWEIKNISKVTTKITNGYVGPTRDILREEGVPYVQATHIKGGKIRFDGEYFVDKSWSEHHKKSILREGDVLVVQTGAGTGDIGLVTACQEGYNCHALIILSSREDLLGAYLADLLMSEYGQQHLESIQTGGMHPHLNCGNVKFAPITLPPVTEQSEIHSYILHQSNAFNRLAEASKRAIELLKQRRSALISAAVTGQIDVRGLTEAKAGEQ
jgi:type I restriction enzyme S subunit